MKLAWLSLAACVACLWIAGCGATRPAAQWQDAELQAGSERVVWEVTRVALQKNDFPLGSGLDPTRMQAVSGWHHSLAPFRGKGFRERCHVQWTHAPGGNWKLEVRVERDRNDDISHPLDLTYADWKPDPDNVERARRVLQYIRSMLAGT